MIRSSSEASARCPEGARIAAWRELRPGPLPRLVPRARRGGEFGSALCSLSPVPCPLSRCGGNRVGGAVPVSPSLTVPFLWNGGRTTSAGTAAPRMTMPISVPALLAAAGTYAIPTPSPSVGLSTPLVTTPASAPSMLTG